MRSKNHKESQFCFKCEQQEVLHVVSVDKEMKEQHFTRKFITEDMEILYNIQIQIKKGLKHSIHLIPQSCSQFKRFDQQLLLRNYTKSKLLQ